MPHNFRCKSMFMMVTKYGKKLLVLLWDKLISWRLGAGLKLVGLNGSVSLNEKVCYIYFDSLK